MKKPNKFTIEELQTRQMYPLSMKIKLTLTRIRAWIDWYGEDGVYVSFSGGKDSTVLSHLVDIARPGNNIPRVFVDTGLEYPEIREFVKKEPRIVILKPKYTFKQVIEKYGYPFISKEVSECVDGAQKYLAKLREQTDTPTHNKRLPYEYYYDKLCGLGKYDKSEWGGRYQIPKTQKNWQIY